MSMLSYVIRKVNTICIRLLNIQVPPHIKYNDINMCFTNEFKPVKPEKTVISIRLDADVLKVLDTLSNDTDISRNELIVQCIDYALKNFHQ